MRQYLGALVTLILIASGCSNPPPTQTCSSPKIICGGATCVDPMTDPKHCGDCEKTCDQGYLCSNGICALGCSSGLIACGQSCVDTMSDPVNCGKCATACGKDEVCSNGKCTLTCDMGLDACSGACVDLMTNSAHCGTCETMCGLGDECVNGTCQNYCGMPLTDCKGTCVDERWDPNNCGACGMICTSPPHTIAYCDKAACGVGPCVNGFKDCNFDPTDGCEADLNSDVNNCSDCFMVCPQPPHVNATCTSGMCMLGACDMGYADCNMDPNDGCEVHPADDINHCGACDTPCPQPANVDVTCDMGMCNQHGCKMGFADCNMDPMDGCEIDINNDPNNCGMCGTVCPMNTPYCSNGMCTTLLVFAGVQNDIKIASLAGWSQCWIGTYGNNYPLMNGNNGIFDQCKGSKLLTGCRQMGSDTLHVAAQGDRVDVLFDTGMGNVTHNANGVGWYYNNSWSWGFAKAGDGVSRNSCDTNFFQDTEQRMCWHTGGNQLNGGYRCGSQVSFGGDYERLVFQAN
jgi:hypothetical protein